MAHKAAVLVNQFVNRLNSLEATRRKVESFATRGSLVRRDVEKVYEALYLRAFTDFEALVEELFLGLLTRRIMLPANRVMPRVEFKSEQVARDVVYGGRSYIDWFPYYKTEKLAEAFFRGGRPFANLDKTDKRRVDSFLQIRNAIAHNSPHARQTFVNEVIGAIPLMPRERTPAGFLRSQLLSLSTPLTRYQYFTIEMVRLARKVCH